VTLGWSVPAASQRAGATTVKLDLAARTTDPTPIPFNRPVDLRISIPSEADAVVMQWREVPRFGAPKPIGAPPTECQLWVRRAPASPSETPPPDKPTDPPKKATRNALVSDAQFVFELEPLLQNRRFALSFQVARAPEGGYLPSEVVNAVGMPVICGYVAAARPLPLDPTAVGLSPHAILTDTLTMFVTTDAPYQSYFDSDAGGLYAYRARFAGAAAGVHIYARPITADEDLARRGLTSWEEIGRRLSLHLGFAFQEVGTSSNVSAATTAGSPFVGVGLRGPFYWTAPDTSVRDSQRRQWQRRLLQGMRVSVGNVWFKQKDPNPLVAQTHTRRDVYTSFTLDIALRDLISPIARFFK
jgi:hypothetical protein